MPQFSDALFHVVRFPTTIDVVAHQLYGDSDNFLFDEFKYVNRLALINGVGLLPGQLLYLPEPICYHPDIKDEIVSFVGMVNERIIYRMDSGERRILADNATFASNAAESSAANAISRNVGLVNTAAGGVLSGVSELTTSIGESLKKLEAAYQNSFRAHGRLTPEFYSRRSQIYRQFDTKLGRLGRLIAFGSPFSANAKSSLKVSTKSNILHWRRNGVGPLIDFQGHFGRLASATRNLKIGGYIAIGLDASLNEFAISEACASGDEDHCLRETYALRGKTLGSASVGIGTGIYGGYAVCNIAFGLPTGGSSLFWCALLAGGAVGSLGGMGGGALGEYGGTKLYEFKFQ